MALPIPAFQQTLGAPRAFDITPDGKRFIMALRPEQTSASVAAAPQIQVVLNWLEELKQRMGSR